MLAMYWYPQLPDRLATHFGAGGAADGWMSKDGFYVFFAALMLGMFGMFSGIVWLVRRMPASMINLPNRDYWLDPERREITFEKLGRNMHHMGSATLLFMTAMLDLSFRANLEAPPRLSPLVWIGLVAFLGGLGLLLLRMYRDFRIKE